MSDIITTFTAFKIIKIATKFFGIFGIFFVNIFILTKKMPKIGKISFLKIMLTKIKIYKKLRDANFQLCSQNNFLAKVLSHFCKMDIYKCPKSISLLDF
jgi:hypothetical protein